MDDLTKDAQTRALDELVRKFNEKQTESTAGTAYWEVTWSMRTYQPEYAIISSSRSNDLKQLGNRRFSSEQKANDLKNQLEAAARILNAPVWVSISKFIVED